MGTRYQGTPREVRALNAYIKLMRAAESLSARISRRLAEQNLTISQFGALESLYHLGPMNQCDLGRKLLKSSGNITLVVDNLAKRGLVRRERGVADRRFVTVHLTDEGRRLIRGIFPGHVQTVVEEMDVLGAAEQEELGRLTRKLGLGVAADAVPARRAASGGARLR
ncbi:MAG TPA: MarR family transcriptional regulator [Gemmatimonadaceae bacterium]|nr:MarR family transcriptional regulator [Gemmatimonadaceae bacterium]